MKLLVFDHDPGITGSTTSLSYIIKGFINQGFNIFVASPKKGKEAEYLKNLGVQIIPFDNTVQLSLHFTNKFRFYTLRGLYSIILLLKNILKGIVLANKILIENEPDLVYINEYVLSQVSIVSKLRKIPTITHIRSLFIWGTFGIRRMFLAKMLLACNDLIIAITQAEAEQFRKYSRKNEQKVIVVREFLDKNNFAENSKPRTKKIFEDFNIPSNKRIVIMLGGFEPWKGTYEFICSLKYLLEEFQDIYYIILGKVHDSKEFQEYNKMCYQEIKLSHLENNIKIISPQTNVIDFLSLSEILVSPITQSHFSRPIIEAWALKKAILTSENLHAKSYIDDHIDGMYFHVEDAKDLADKILYLLNNDEVKKKIGENGYCKALELFNAEKNVSLIVEHCINILNKIGLKH